MSHFDVYNHVDSRIHSLAIAEMLDATVGRAIERECRKHNIRDEHIRVVSFSVNNALQSSLDAAINYHVKGRQFNSRALALSFFIGQLQSLLKDELDPHRHHFINSRHSDDKWGNTVGTICSETIALLDALFTPPPPKRPGYR